MRGRTGSAALRWLRRGLLLAVVCAGILAAPAAQAKVKLNLTKKTLKAGATQQLLVKGAKEEVTVTWSSSNSKVAAVSEDGLVKALRAGSAKITARIKGESVSTKKTCRITVKPKSASAVKNAKKLRNYVLKRGKKMEGGRYLEKRKWVDPDLPVTVTRVLAAKKSTRLVFNYSWSSDTPDYGYQITLSVDPSGETLGVIEFISDVEDYSNDYFILTGVVTEAYDGGETGIIWEEPTVYTENDAIGAESEDDPYLPSAESLKERGTDVLARAMKEWQTLIKKSCVRMKKRGFKHFS